jgi:zinc protease
MKELRQNLGITYGISASIIPKKHGSAIFGFMSTDSSAAGKAISAVKDVLSKVKKEGIDEQLFKDAKTSLVNNLAFFLSNNTNTAILLDDIQINDRDVNRINNYTNVINDVKLEEVNKLASSLLDPENLFFVEVGKNAKS